MLNKKCKVRTQAEGSKTLPMGLGKQWGTVPRSPAPKWEPQKSWLPISG